MEIFQKWYLARETLTWGAFSLEGPCLLDLMPKSKGT